MTEKNLPDLELEGPHSTNILKRPQKTNLWLFDKSYPNAEEADREITNSTDWSVYRTQNTENGTKRYFRCNRIQLPGEQCAAAMYLLYDTTEEKVIQFRTSEEHNHELMGSQAQPGFTTELRTEIEKLYNFHMKPKDILDSLTKIIALPLPSKIQLKDYLSFLRKEKCKPMKIDFMELATRLKERSIPSSNEHASFIVAHEVSLPEEVEQSFRFFISTTHLIGLARKANVIHASAKCILCWQTYPMFVVGTTDKDNNFHPFGLSVSNHLQVEDFKFFFEALKDSVQTYYDNDLTPKFLMCNAEENIEKAFMEVFGPNIPLLTCWTNVRNNILKHVLKLTDSKRRVEILNDIDTIQLAASKDIFQKACGLFLDKWRDEVEFCTYFKNEWLDRHQNWFEGAASGFPSTNNALKSFSIAIRNSNTVTVRFTLANFLTKAMDMISNWSNEYKHGNKRVVDTPTICQRLWIDSYQWAKLPKNILKSGNSDSCSLYRVPANNNSRFCAGYNAWSTFDSFKELYFDEYHVSLPLGREGWLSGNCSCPTFMKKFICKHILGMAITLKEVKPPADVRIEEIGDSFKRKSSARTAKCMSTTLYNLEL